MARFKSSKKLKEWFAERCGELLVKFFTHNISCVYDEVSEQHPDAPRDEIISSFRTANPKSCQYAAPTYDELYERGAEKNNLESTNNNRVLGYLAIDRQIKLQEVRAAITKAIVEGPISVIDSLGRISTIDPKLLDIFDKDHELQGTCDKNGSQSSDGSDELKSFNRSARVALPRPGPGSDGK